MTFEENIKKIVQQQLVNYTEGEDFNDIKVSDNLQNDLGADSLDMIELMMAMEDKFDLEIQENEWSKEIVTVNDILDLVNRYDAKR